MPAVARHRGSPVLPARCVPVLSDPMLNEGISRPITRAVDKALRMLSLTYEIHSARWGVSAASLHRALHGYQALKENPPALERMFEHDKADLRALDIPIFTQLVGDPPESRYRLDSQRLTLTAGGPADPRWELLRLHAPRLQAIADQLPQLDGRDAAPLSHLLLALRHDLGLRIPQWSIPRALMTNARVVLEWIHCLLQTVEALGRRDNQFGGAHVSLEEIAELTGFPPSFIWHVADRGAGPADEFRMEGSAVQIGTASPEEGVFVISRELRRAWRPRRVHVEALIAWTERQRAPLPPELLQALRQLQRGATPAQVELDVRQHPGAS